MFTVNEICEVLEVKTIDQAILSHVQNFESLISRGFPRPAKREIKSHSDRKYNLAVTAIDLLLPIQDEIPQIKSVTPVRYFGEANHSGSWCARIRYADGKEFFAGIGAGYNLAQAQALISNNTVDTLCLQILTKGVHIRTF